MKIKIATRKSQLALWQAKDVKHRLCELHPDLEVELVTMTTQGDKILDTPLAKIGGKGLFVKELENALLDGRADIAVHSMKDVPMALPEDLELYAICAREDARDAFVSFTYEALDDLPQGAVVGTSSLRRHMQLKALRPDLDIQSLRGNVNTRLKKCEQGDYDAIILATAGLKRLALQQHIKEPIAVERILPAVGQGAVGIECRSGDAKTKTLLDGLRCQKTTTCVDAERAMNTRLNGGCQVPIGGYAIWQGETVWLRGMVGCPDTGQLITAEAKGSAADVINMGQAVADELLHNGAKEILEKIYA